MGHHPSVHDHQHEEVPDLLDLDAEVLTEARDAVRVDIGRLVDAPVRSILDLGAGTGSGTFGLLRHFPDAHALALDSSEEMLDRLRSRAEDEGLVDRISTLRADLDEALPEIDPVDLAGFPRFVPVGFPADQGRPGRGDGPSGHGRPSSAIGGGGRHLRRGIALAHPRCGRRPAGRPRTARRSGRSSTVEQTTYGVVTTCRWSPSGDCGSSVVRPIDSRARTWADG